MSGIVVVLGAGESGVGAALLARKVGYDVFVSDYGSISEKYKEELKENNILFEERGHHLEKLEIEFVIKSPGVPDAAPEVERLRNLGVKIISEIEFGSRHYQGTILAVTGSNGKTTTSGLLCHLLKTADYDVRIGGNYGISFARIVSESSPEYVVLELSSFQLDDIEEFSADVSILLNITSDHLDRYGYDINNYAKAKYRITENQTEEDVFIYNEDDKIINGLIQQDTPKAVLKSISQTDYISGIARKDGDHYFEMLLKGKHNLFNARCAVETARTIGLAEEQIAKGLSTFVNEAHRLEEVATIADVTYINDSKATNVDAVYYALDAMERPVVWIAGGTDKGNDYSSLFALIEGRVKGLICLGLDNEKLKQSFHDKISIIKETQSMIEAVKLAEEIADEGDVVLLSPACASFDLFDNYIDRGNQFKDSVHRL